MTSVFLSKFLAGTNNSGAKINIFIPGTQIYYIVMIVGFYNKITFIVSVIHPMQNLLPDLF